MVVARFDQVALRLEQDLRRYLRRYTMLLDPGGFFVGRATREVPGDEPIEGYTLITIGLMLGAVAYPGFILSRSFCWIAAVSGVCMVAFVWQMVREMQHLRQKCREKLADSGLLERLVAGDELWLGVFDEIPQPWRSLFIGPLPVSMSGRLHLMACNLCWLLNPGWRPVRWHWVALLGFVISLPTLFAFGCYAGCPGTALACMTCPALVIAIILLFIWWRRVLSLHYMIHYVRQFRK